MNRTNELFPKPKKMTLTGGTMPLPLTYQAEEFLPAAEAFGALLNKERSLSLTPGEDGLRLIKGCGGEESYSLTIDNEGITLTAATNKGINLGLSTLYQLICQGEDGKVPCLRIEDEPDASYRGLMIDLARAWHEPDWLFRYVDLCWKCRASHLQLHFTDDQLFTLPIASFPAIGEQRYPRETIAELVEYAEIRGITLVPEVDLPGHTALWMKAYPELFGTTTVLAASEEVFAALRTIFAEVHEMFPHSSWIHIGGDEADTSQWEICPITQAFMKENGIGTVGELYGEFIRRAAEIVLELGCTPVVWEGFAKEYNDRIPKETIVIAWESLYQKPQDIAAAGFTMINCSWEPLYICTNNRYWSPEDIMNWDLWTYRNWWERSYAYPDGIVVPKESTRVIGGQICVWGNWLGCHGDLAADLETEYQLTAERLPALCQRTWNV